MRAASTQAFFVHRRGSSAPIGNLNKNVKILHDQAEKAMFALLARCNKYALPVDLQLKLFDAMILPIVMYGAEVWGYCNIQKIESLHLKFCKYILNVKPSTRNFMIYGEPSASQTNYDLRPLASVMCELVLVSFE